MNSFLKDTFRVAFSKGIVIFFGLGSSIITARYLGPELNGVIAGLLVYPGLFMTVGSLGIRQSATYFLGKKIYSEDNIKKAITQIWMFTTVISLLICFILMRYVSNFGDNLFWVLIALIPLPFSLFNTYNSGIFLGKNDIKTFNEINWIPSLLSFLGLIILVIAFRLKVSGALISFVAGPFFVALILLFKNKFISSFSLKFDWAILKSMLSLGVVYAIALFVINLNYRIDIILLDNLSNSFEMGIYAKGAGLSQYLWQIPAILSTIVFARSAVSKEVEEFSLKVAQLLRISFILICILSLILFFISPKLIVGFYGINFYKSIIVFQVLLPGVIILTIFKVMNMDLAGKGKPWISMIAMIPALIINIILNIVLIPAQGANGAAFASTVSYSIAGLLFLHFYSKEVKVPIKEILHFKKTDFDPFLKVFNKLKK